MPVKPGRACSRSGCPGVVKDGVCSVCGPLHPNMDSRQYDRQRGTASQRGYGAHWRKVRARVLSKHPLCAECLKHGIVAAATDVHHVIAKRNGGLDSEDNLEPLCHACHSRITREEMHQGVGGG